MGKGAFKSLYCKNKNSCITQRNLKRKLGKLQFCPKMPRSTLLSGKSLSGYSLNTLQQTGSQVLWFILQFAYLKAPSCFKQVLVLCDSEHRPQQLKLASLLGHCPAWCPYFWHLRQRVTLMFRFIVSTWFPVWWRLMCTCVTLSALMLLSAAYIIPLRISYYSVYS